MFSSVGARFRIENLSGRSRTCDAVVQITLRNDPILALIGYAAEQDMIVWEGPATDQFLAPIGLD
ncbi:MAG: hypothetical protein JWR80_6822 [Bradyrhizobium sp.]|nr:hypothetical protein [Bradyrhizobium sp.]